MIRSSSIHVRSRGAGAAVLCLHGIGSSADSFDSQLAELGERRLVLAWDAPGYARSADPESPLTMDDFADSAAAVLADAGIGVAHIVGVSFGGVVAVRLALRHPGIVRSLVLADSTPGSGVSPERAADMRRRVVELARLGPRAYAAERAPNLLSASAPADLVARVTSAMAAAIRLPGFGYVAEAMASTDHRTRFCEISAPTLVLCGEHDSVAPPTVSKAIAAAVPGARFTSIRGAGHLSNQERPDVFNRHVEAFFDSC